MLKTKRNTILLYGTYHPADTGRATSLIKDFTRIALGQGYSFITRNGGTEQTQSQWPESSDQLPVDNAVIEAVATYFRARRSGGKHRIRERLTTFITPDRTAYVNIGQATFSCPIRRYEMYSCFFDRADIIVLVGGNNGVLRMGLLCHFVDKPFVAITAFGGAAQEIGDSFYGAFEMGHYQNIEREDALILEKKDVTGSELFSIVKKNLRSPLIARPGLFLRGKMGLGEFIQWVWRESDHVLSLLGKLLLLGAVIFLALYLAKGAVDAFVYIFTEIVRVSISP